MPSLKLTTFKWMSIVLCTLLAGGGVFWATSAEPIAHFVQLRLFMATQILKRWRSTPYHNLSYTGVSLHGQS
ncbi:BCCT family transporter [Vibrio lentus]|nr:BCCT family transporter [Vibrio lentus]